MPEYSKVIKRLLREHAALAHEEELRRALLPLGDEFDRWRRGEVGSEGLSGHIHEFHQGPAREIWKRYHQGLPDVAVAYAIWRGILQREKVPAELLEALDPALAFYESLDGDVRDGAAAEE